MIKKIIPAILIIGIIAAFIYYKLGGGETLSFEIKEQMDMYVSGQEFTGKYNDPEMEKLFFKAKKIAESCDNCNLTVVNYLLPENADSVRQFIGVTSMDSTMISSLALSDVRVFHDPIMVSTTIRAHNFVMPRPEEVRMQASDFAQENSYNIQDISIEIYKNSRDLEILFPVKK